MVNSLVLYHSVMGLYYRQSRKDVLMKEVPNLVMASDMAARWGVDRRVVNNWTKRDPSFPRPIMIVGCGKYPLYLEAEMIAYAKRKGIERNE